MKPTTFKVEDKLDNVISKDPISTENIAKWKKILNK